MFFTALAIVLGVAIGATVLASALNRGLTRARLEAQRSIQEKLRRRGHDSPRTSSYAPSRREENEGSVERVTMLLAGMIGISEPRAIADAETVGSILLAPLSEISSPPSRGRIEIDGEQFIDGFSDEFLEVLKENVAPENWAKLAAELKCDVRDEDALLRSLYAIRMSDAIPLLSGLLK